MRRTLFAVLMMAAASSAFAQNVATGLPFRVLGFQLDSSSPLVLHGDLLGDNARWQLKIRIPGGTTQTIPNGPGFPGAACREEYREAQILAQDATLTVAVYATRCEPYSSSGTPTGAYSANGVYGILGGTGKFAGVIGGTGSIQFDANSDGLVFVSIGGVIWVKGRA
jgi:hypothetical protein